MLRTRLSPAALLAAAALSVGCAGADDHKTDGVWTQGPSADSSGHALRETEALRELSGGGDTPSLFGVRHDLELRRERGGLTSCGCVVAHVGEPGDGRFSWHGEVPGPRSDALVIAISSQDVPCDAQPDGTKRRASISAVDEADGNVYVEIEDLPAGRPVALGAIIPKPHTTGHVYLRPKNRKTMYGRGGAGGCRLN